MQLVFYWSLDKKKIPCGGDIQLVIYTDIYEVHCAQVWLNLLRNSLECWGKQDREIDYIYVKFFYLLDDFGDVLSCK